MDADANTRETADDAPQERQVIAGVTYLKVNPPRMNRRDRRDLARRLNRKGGAAITTKAVPDGEGGTKQVPVIRI